MPKPLTHTQNVFYSRPTIHKQTQWGLQMQNIIHKLMHFVLQITNVPIKQIGGAGCLAGLKLTQQRHLLLWTANYRTFVGKFSGICVWI